MWRLDYSVAALRDFDLILDHLSESYYALGDPHDVALERAAERVRQLRFEIGRLVETPAIGTLRSDIYPEMRFIRRDRATVWFVPIQEHRIIAVTAVFYGAQDHIRHMRMRLLDDSPL